MEKTFFPLSLIFISRGSTSFGDSRTTSSVFSTLSEILFAHSTNYSNVSQDS